jgi:uncharacterized membrane protein YgcG
MSASSSIGRSVVVRSVVLVAAWLLLTGSALAGSALAAEADIPARPAGSFIVDGAEVLDPGQRDNLDSLAETVADASGVEILVVTQRGTEAPSVEAARAVAGEALAAWPAEAGGRAVVIAALLGPDGPDASLGLAVGPGAATRVDAGDAATIEADAASWLESGDADTAIHVAMAQVMRELFDPTTDAEPAIPADPTGPGGPAGPAADAPPPGPPFPDPVTDQAVYDNAGIWNDATRASVEATIDAIEARTGAEIAVYSQVVDYGVTTGETEARARALIDQWGIGRAGFDDGMVVFFDMDPSLEHGQVQLYAAPGFEATFLSNEQRQRIFDEDMLPFLRNADMDGALLVAMERIDAAATPENARALQLGRQINAVLGLVLAPVVFLGLAGWAFFSWRRFGKDPVYLDDPSILMPAPPEDLTAASGAFVMDGGSSRRALTTAMLDLASRGLVAFREEDSLLPWSSRKVGIETEPAPGDDVEEARRRLNARRPTGPAEAVALRRLNAIDGKDHYIEPDDLLKFGEAVPAFDSALEEHVVDKGWMVEKPSKVKTRWVGRGALAIGAGALALFAGANIPISGLLLVGGAAIAGGIVLILFAQGMPTVTMPGAMIRAMLHAYRRTLQKTMEQARSMEQVVEGARAQKMDWLVTPDQAVVWGTALGLQGEIEEVLKRSLEDVERGASAAGATYFPAWYHNSSGQSLSSAVASGSGGSIFSGSAVPDLGGMMSALGTIGNSPSSSGSGGGGGFSGGGSGGGGGGAGGGF